MFISQLYPLYIQVCLLETCQLCGNWSRARAVLGSTLSGVKPLKYFPKNWSIQPWLLVVGPYHLASLMINAPSTSQLTRLNQSITRSEPPNAPSTNQILSNQINQSSIIYQSLTILVHHHYRSPWCHHHIHGASMAPCTCTVPLSLAPACPSKWCIKVHHPKPPQRHRQLQLMAAMAGWFARISLAEWLRVLHGSW